MKKKLLNILLFGFIFHSLRDTLQLFGFEFWLTNVFHEFGVKATNTALNFLNISYSRWVDIVFLFVEQLIQIFC